MNVDCKGSDPKPAASGVLSLGSWGSGFFRTLGSSVLVLGLRV